MESVSCPGFGRYTAEKARMDGNPKRRAESGYVCIARHRRDVPDGYVVERIYINPHYPDDIFVQQIRQPLNRWE